jgi:hypothetical protein
MDKLSDYVPGSNEISRVPSRQESASIEEVESEVEEEEDDEEKEDDEDFDDEVDGDGDETMGRSSKPKTPGELRRIEESKQRRDKLDKKKEKKKELDTVVCLLWAFISEYHANHVFDNSTLREKPPKLPTNPPILSNDSLTSLDKLICFDISVILKYVLFDSHLPISSNS